MSLSTNGTPNWKRIESQTQVLIQILHEELNWFDDEAIQNTAKRITKFYAEFCEQQNFNFTMFEPDRKLDELIGLSNITFYSLCAHHMLPFIGTVGIAYIPNEEKGYCGVSKLARAVTKFASKPNTQEVMTNEIKDYLVEELKPRFLFIKVSAQHMCMTMRGAKQSDTVMKTNALYFDSNTLTESKVISLKQEAIKMLNGD